MTTVIEQPGKSPFNCPAPRNDLEPFAFFVRRRFQVDFVRLVVRDGFPRLILEGLNDAARDETQSPLPVALTRRASKPPPNMKTLALMATNGSKGARGICVP